MTIKDLSRETGYSVGTVSRVLNHHPNVSEKARKTILAAIEKSGFEPNENARILKQGKSEGILALVKGRRNELFAQIIEHLQHFFAETDYSLTAHYFDENDNEVLQAVQLCSIRKPQGLLFLGGNSSNFLSDFGQIDIPAVLLTDNAENLPFRNLSSVFTDDSAAAECAVNHLIENGHRKIAVIGGDIKVSDTSAQRFEGCLKAMLRGGLRPTTYVQALFSYDGGFAAMQSILASEERPTAVFAMSDVMAIGAIRAICDAGLRVPEDISVCGIDGLDISNFINPCLTTIRQDSEQIALHGARLLIDTLERRRSAMHEIIPFELRKRGSVKTLQKV